MDWKKILKIFLNREFEYHKKVSAESCFKLIETHSNQYYEEWKKRFSLSTIETPFYVRKGKEFAFSIGHKTFGRTCEIYGYIEKLNSFSAIRIQMRPLLWKELIISPFFWFPLMYLIGEDFGEALVLFALVMLMSTVWRTIEGICLMNRFEKILEKF